ncbi:CHC2 zinc finger domain-containing protein [Methylosarcina fibrata]|uniref:CHC2 zinc finger domain-containing protein n=1 Tax=Methylosarcina fibrata TaxID=105972 RepID=UPI000378ABA2|nr:CHC2 zinc finger domain-containing protein [Methylosarcina fibrata]
MIEKLITRLDGVKRTGHGRYIARCPAHADKSPSLTITEKGGKILFHCFAGCEPADVLAAIGLTFSDLYPEKSTYNKGSSRTAAFNPYDVLKCLAREAGIVTLAARQIVHKAPLSETDAERVDLAYNRLRDAAELMGVRL